ncbi:MAG: ion transporter [Saprospiraceae bacterium]|nr:ion transporter [Saprospiraceae bacterium]
MVSKTPQLPTKSRKSKIYEIIFESDTSAGKFFDVALLCFIVVSIIVVLLESIQTYRDTYHLTFRIIEWIVTFFFLIEYLLRLYSIKQPLKYALSFYGIIDLLAILPTFLAFVISGGQSLMVIRGLRLLRVFRIFKLGSFMAQGNIILQSLNQSKGKIAIFLYFILIIVLIIGSLMYVIEGEQNDGFDSIPTSIYWAIVTLTTVGYGDITPATNIGKFISALVMILGYSVIAVPTGIVSASMINQARKVNGQACPHCGKEGHDNDARFCKHCGGDLSV